MAQQSLGLIEAVGLAAAIKAADAATKSANVELIGYEHAKGSGLTMIKVQGDVGAVNAAVDAAKSAAAAVNEVVVTRVIPRPQETIDAMIFSTETTGLKAKPES